MVGGFSDGTYLLSDITPDEFEGTEYFNLYYRRTRLLEEVGVLISLSENRHMLVSMGHRDGDAGSPRTDKLIACQPFLAAACRKHWSLRKPDAPEEDTTFAAPLESVYQNFGRDLLSDREREVMLLLLRGHSSKSMAQRMGISPETVKVHRRNLYTKVDVASQAELFSVFLDSLAGVRIGSQEDPLARYNQI